MPNKSEVMKLGDIPVRVDATAHVLVSIDAMLNKTLPKLPNLVSSPIGPLGMQNAIPSNAPNATSIVIKIEIPLPVPTSFAYAIGNASGITF
jgi:hypothetical protein